MEPIQPVSSNVTPIRNTQAPVNGTKVSAAGAQESGVSQSAASSGAVSSQTAMSSVTSSESLTATNMSQRVEAFLGSVDSALANNAYLKLLIAALIMQVLLGEDGGAQQSSAGLQGLEALTGGRNTSMYLAIETSTNTVQLSQQSSRLDVTSAVQTMSESGTTTEDSGRQMDVTG